jgi:hypothetical protein
MYEVKHFRYAKRGIFPKEKLCPVLFYFPFGLVIIMKKAKPMTEQEFEQFDSNSFCELGNAVLPVERKADSFGWVGDKIVATDYE